jgi:hypothetical protein
MDPGSYVIWGAVPETSQGNSFETQSLYVNDTWRLNDKLTVNLGVRYDQNEGTDQGGAKTVDDSRISPRLSASYDVQGNGRLVVTAGLSRYTMSIANSVGDVGSAAGNPVYNLYVYDGPSIVGGTAAYPTNGDAIDAVFDWFNNVYGGVTNLDNLVYAYVPGLTPQVGQGLNSPYGDEATIGVSYRLGNRGVVRADYVHREYHDFYASSIVPNNTVSDPAAGTFDLAEYVNYDAGLERKYDALMARLDYRIGTRWNIGANYTWSETKGNIDGETGGGGPAASTVLTYQEYKDPSWNTPVGLLATDQTHKFRAWVQYDLIASTHHNLNISLLQNYFSGTPYSAVQTIDTIPYVGDPGDLGYIGSSLGPVNYYFSDRGAFRTDTVTSTDLAINYSFFLSLGGAQLEVFVQPEVTNIFNEDAVLTPNTTVLGPRQGYDAFNPFTETPVQGVNWDFGENFGQPQSANDYQLPRTFRVSFGLRF